MKVSKLLALTCVTLHLQAIAAEAPPEVPYVDVSNTRIPAQQARSNSGTANQRLMAEMDRMAAEQQRQLEAAKQANEQLLAEQVNSPGNQFLKDAINKYKPSMALALKPKDSIVIPVGQGLLNTIATNFKELRVKTSDNTSIIETDGGHLYISITSTNPVGLVLYEAGVKESQVSISLIPIDAPPVIADINVSLTDEMLIASQQYQKEQQEIEAQLEAEHERISYSDKHKKRVVELLTPVAQGDFPKGFTLTNEIPMEAKTPCRISLPHHAGQRIIGSNEIIDVVLVQNTSNKVYQVREEACLSDDVIAVALFKKSYLSPGDSMELYILRDKHYKQEVKRQHRRQRLTEIQ